MVSGLGIEGGRRIEVSCEIETLSSPHTRLEAGCEVTACISARIIVSHRAGASTEVVHPMIQSPTAVTDLRQDGRIPSVTGAQSCLGWLNPRSVSVWVVVK